ncbi:MAG TPA: isoprenylcysteine carboxylmethyltransferase family protein [Thermodesulfobacteriota bacterium]|nr:isoprenylcysteine carboxylmethyltransferase family protein [Thermodesulfobacteriota bacterium]
MNNVTHGAPGADRPDVLALPPLILLGFVACGLLANQFYALPFVSGNARYVTGAVLAALPFLITALAMKEMGKAGTNIDVRKPATAIVTGGIYGVTRNPMYLSMVLILAAGGFLLNNLWLLIAVPIFVAVMQKWVIQREERYLEKKFGGVYTAYKSRVRRWL